MTHSPHMQASPPDDDHKVYFDDEFHQDFDDDHDELKEDFDDYFNQDFDETSPFQFFNLNPNSLC